MNIMCGFEGSKILLGSDPQMPFFTRQRVDRSVCFEKGEAA